MKRRSASVAEAKPAYQGLPWARFPVMKARRALLATKKPARAGAAPFFEALGERTRTRLGSARATVS